MDTHVNDYEGSAAHVMNLYLTDEEKNELAGKRQLMKLLNFLRGRGRQGATNIELNQLMFRYSARISELRALGYEIEISFGGSGVNTYVLSGYAE